MEVPIDRCRRLLTFCRQPSLNSQILGMVATDTRWDILWTGKWKAYGSRCLGQTFFGLPVSFEPAFAPQNHSTLQMSQSTKNYPDSISTCLT